MPGVTRRGALVLAAGAAVTGAGLGAAVVTGNGPSVRPARESESPGAQTVPVHGGHQAGVADPAPAHARFLAFDLRAPAPDARREALARMMRLLSDDAERLTAGRAALGDTEPELATPAAGLTITVGWSPQLFAAIGRSDRRPAGVGPVPAFAGDRLQERWSGGDVLVQLCGGDLTTLAHAARMVVKDVRPLATVRWQQDGFRGSGPGTARNLLGQLDGTVNPTPGTPEFDRVVWSGEGWFSGGTVLVLRRIRFDVEGWDAFDRAGKDLVLGRRLADGAPLTGAVEADVPDLTALGPDGFPVIDERAHVRLAHARHDGERMLRRGYNYDAGVDAHGRPDVGLVFAAYQRDVRAFVAVQQRLAATDDLNRWVTHIGSAVFALLPGCPPGERLGDAVLV